MKRLLIICSLLVVACASVRAQQQDFSGVEIKAEKVAGNIYMLTGAGGNIGVSVDRKSVV